tara:strand:- start:93 stop:656 length:564 start_codon:yes stop_codon:yes gene_type:complete
MGKAKKVNLNKLIEDKSRKRQQVFKNTEIKIHFNGHSIVNAICRQIKKESTHYIIGCAAWLTNTKILDTMAANAEGVCLIVTRDKITRAKTNQMKYKKLKKLNDAKSPIQVIGVGSGYNKSLLHHKFLVGLDESKKPLWVANGSFNFTKSAVNHLENCMIIENEEVAKLFKAEFMRLFPISRPLRLK